MKTMEQNQKLFFDQKELLDLFLHNGAIGPAQYVKSLSCLAEKMGFGDLPEVKEAIAAAQKTLQGEK